MRAGVVMAVLWLLVSGGAGGAAAEASTPAHPWIWPLDGPVTVVRPFAPPATRYGAGHRGADLAGPPGAVVRAAGAGRVTYAGLLAGRGVVVVNHGQLRTTYEPVAATVRVGQVVARGAVIGHLTAGHAGCPQACLHWGLLRGDVYLDPVGLVRKGPSILLPLDRPPALPAGPLPLGAAAAPASPTRSGGRAAADADPTVQPAVEPAAEPAFALRSAEAAWSGAAVVALVAGLELLRRAPRPPAGPAAPRASAPPPGPAPGPTPPPVPVPSDPVDLAAERHRRRPTVA